MNESVRRLALGFAAMGLATCGEVEGRGDGDSDTDTDVDTDADVDTDTGTDTGTNTDTGTGTGTDTGTDTETGERCDPRCPDDFHCVADGGCVPDAPCSGNLWGSCDEGETCECGGFAAVTCECKPTGEDECGGCPASARCIVRWSGGGYCTPFECNRSADCPAEEAPHCNCSAVGVCNCMNTPFCDPECRIGMLCVYGDVGPNHCEHPPYYGE